MDEYSESSGSSSYDSSVSDEGFCDSCVADEEFTEGGFEDGDLELAGFDDAEESFFEEDGDMTSNDHSEEFFKDEISEDCISESEVIEDSINDSSLDDSMEENMQEGSTNEIIADEEIFSENGDAVENEPEENSQENGDDENDVFAELNDSNNTELVEDGGINQKEELSDEQSDAAFAAGDQKREDFSDRLDGFFQPDAKADLPDNSSEKYDSEQEWFPPAIDGRETVDPVADIEPLEETQQDFSYDKLDDGTPVRVFDHPEELQEVLPCSQGNNNYNKNETCVLAGTGVLLETAGSGYGENAVVGFSSTHANESGKPLCDEVGGTFPEDIPTIWDHFGMPAYLDSSKNLESIAEAVEHGQAVMVGVNAGNLWERDNAEGFVLNSPENNCYGDGGANHAISVLSCERNLNSGNVTSFYINDTGRSIPRDSCRKISVEDFWHAFHVDRAVAVISKKPVR